MCYCCASDPPVHHVYVAVTVVPQILHYTMFMLLYVTVVPQILQYTMFMLLYVTVVPQILQYAMFMLLLLLCLRSSSTPRWSTLTTRTYRTPSPRPLSSAARSTRASGSVTIQTSLSGYRPTLCVTDCLR